VEGVFAQIGVELHQFKSIWGVTLVFASRVIALPILGTHDSDNFSNFAFFLRHGTNLNTVLRTRQNIYYGQKANRFATCNRLVFPISPQ
jgi:7,8-dihydro-6-hydroxymethylpterin-pyrophosphokinase